MAAQSVHVSEMLRPLEALNLGALYSRNAALFDLVIYLVLFNGMAQSVLTKRLEGKGGRMVAGAIGTALALALAGLEARTGFSLLALGPTAAIILLALLGIVIYRTLRSLKASATVASSFSVLLIASGLQSMAPAFAAQLSASFPFLDVAAGVALLVLAWKGVEHLLPRQSEGRIEAAAKQVESSVADAQGHEPPWKGPSQGSGVARIRGELRRERPEIGHHLKAITKKEEKSSRQIVKELQLIEDLLQNGKHPAKDRKQIAEALRAIPPKRHELHRRIEQVKDLDARLGRFDLALLAELRSALEKVPAVQRPAIKQMALEERDKVRTEERIAVVERFVATYDANAAQIVEAAAEAIVKNDTAKAASWVQAALRYEEEAERWIRRIEAVERMLRRITRLELRQVKRVA